MSFNEILEEVEKLDEVKKLTLIDKIQSMLEFGQDSQVITKQILLSEKRLDIIEAGEVDLHEIDQFEDSYEFEN